MSFSSFSQQEAKPCEKVEKMLYLIQKLHVQPPTFDKAFVASAIENFLFYIDGQCRSLYEKDIVALNKIQADEENPSAAFCKSYNYLLTVYEKRLKETDSILTSSKTKKYTWNKTDSITFFDEFKNAYSKTEAIKVKRIDDWLKMNTLRQMDVSGKLEKDFEFEKNDNLKVKAILKMRKALNKKMNPPNGIASYLEENLLQAIMATCDPHSDYFTPTLNKQFKESLSTDQEIYGFSFQENKEEHLEITALAPGSPAWKSNGLNVGDQIIKIKLHNKPEVDVSDYDGDEFSKLLDMSTEKELDLTVIKKSGEVSVVHLKKAIVHSEENTVNGYVLTGKYPIGYISLPSFYTDFSQATANGCANDVAKEISKLNEDNIQGLIIDVRNNGGGSVAEAMNLAGIFIDAGPLFVEKTKAPKPFVMKDMNRGAIYTGPLLILINKGSASASELFAQMMKTQQRAIVAGTNSFGKATGQVIVPLDTTVSTQRATIGYNEKNGYIKITIEKLYDLSGNTYQNQGVKPDILIPDLWSGLYKSEKEYKHVLPNESIDKKVKIEVQPDTKIVVCEDLSETRVKNSNLFKRTLSLGDTLKSFFGRNTYPLYPTTYNEILKKEDVITDLVDTVFSKPADDLLIKPTKNMQEIIKMDSFLNTTISKEIEDLKKDAILREAYYILMDYNSN
ncbi:MAG TPA: S41 family peptidase [Bacteroidia bacterium]|jgi:carboxyl-terminal processing protease|nr:S41 family peptidase [Bacteroidia bacterium]